MKLQLGELRLIMDGLPKVIQEKLPVKTSYWLQRALRDISKEFMTFEQTRQKLINEHGKRYEKDKKDKKGQVIEKKGELIIKGNQFIMKDQKAFDKDYEELAEQEIEIKFEPIPIEKFEDKEGKTLLKGIDLMNLGRLIKEE